MFKRVAPYMGEYKKYTVWAAIMMSIGIIANVSPYFFMYQIIAPLTRGEHIGAYNTLKNLRVSLQGKLEKQPLGNIQELGTGWSIISVILMDFLKRNVPDADVK